MTFSLSLRNFSFLKLSTMKRLSLLLIIIAILSCERNKLPTCEITQPSNNEVFIKGDKIFVSVNAEDTDGSVAEVRIYLNNVGLIILENFPYNYEINSGDYDVGAYTIKATVSDNIGEEVSDEVQISIEANSPSVETDDVTDIKELSATCGGEVVSDGGLAVTEKGVCWSTSQNPTVSDNKTSDGTGTGSYSSAITGLTCGTTYYVRAYATNSAGTGYGNEVPFTTSPCLMEPTVSTSSMSNITQTTAQGGGNIISDGASTITSKGICWSTSPDPTISNNKTNDGTGTGTYSSLITNLTPFTTYYVRAYAANSVGISYGNEESFTSLWDNSTTVSDYNGHVYSTIQIGDQIWIGENMKVYTYNGGKEIPWVPDESNWDALSTSAEAYCWYENSTFNRDIYGGLYTWTAAMAGAASSSSNPSGVQGICPDGYHIPSDAEWKQLEIYLGISAEEVNNTGRRGVDEGGNLKHAGTKFWSTPNTGATNETGFTGLPGGFRRGNGTFAFLGTNCNFWSATQYDLSNAWFRGLNFDHSQIYRGDYSKKMGLSVRCLRD